LVGNIKGPTGKKMGVSTKKKVPEHWGGPLDEEKHHGKKKNPTKKTTGKTRGGKCMRKNIKAAGEVFQGPEGIATCVEIT